MSFILDIEKESELGVAIENQVKNAHDQENCRLVLSHVTSYQRLEDIVKDKCLSPQKCRVLNDDVIYFSYGPPFYKKTAHYIKKPGDYPIVFVMDAKVNDDINCYYPFDSGAAFDTVCGKGYGSDWVDLSQLNHFHVKDNPQDIVTVFYKNNKNYFNGHVVRKKYGKKSELALLQEFLLSDLDLLSIDDRQKTIECVSVNKISLICNVKWVAYPRFLLGQGNAHKLLKRLWEGSSDRFKLYDYEIDANQKHDYVMSAIKEAFKKEFKYLVEA